ncbi:MAG: helix-turn-helix transcriptional regulator [Planctomycetales bacterium]|nr:helix-turn-helix transcriptional regulator [Planctomycetales bacterium]
MKQQHEIRSEVRRFRLNAAMTQQDLATKIGVTRQTVVAIEKGNYTPSVALALQLALVFQVRVEDLFQLASGKSTDV